MSGRLPDGLLLSFYGDDFTGSAAVMEVMTFAGLPTVLFLSPPTAAQMATFEGYRGIGIAGVARAQSPQWMAENLPPIFKFLAGLEAPFVHYKVCSTFDSAPHVGSIGKAIDIAAPIVGGDWYPLLIAAPAIQRYQAMGNLFAIADGQGYRLDRHPTMRRHPVTPMHEADVRVHLGRQTDKPIGLVDFTALKAGRGDEALAAARAGGAEIIAFDVIDKMTLVDAGRLVWENLGDRCFAIGSQGLEYALVAYWFGAGLLPANDDSVEAPASDHLLVVSGSCSPVTAQQIDRAKLRGFAAIAIDTLEAIDDGRWETELDRVSKAALDAWRQGQDPLLYTAKGPDDLSIARLETAIREQNLDTVRINARIGDGLGRILDRLLRETGIKRAVIAGGDTSSHGLGALDIYALTAMASITPAASLNRAHSNDPAHAGLEIALKGGQMGEPDYFAQIRAGRRKIG
ncbi:MAG: four-carbon acid sugar kinase family protein [Pseudomonadota bacterium]